MLSSLTRDCKGELFWDTEASRLKLSMTNSCREFCVENKTLCAIQSNVFFLGFPLR